MSSIIKETVTLPSGIEANIAVVNVERFLVELFNDAPPSDWVSKIEAALANGRLAARTYPVAHPSRRNTISENIFGFGNSQLELWADRAIDIGRSYREAGVTVKELWQDRRGEAPTNFPVPIAHTDLMRLRSASLERDEIFTNANYFLFEPREFDTPFEAYGDPVGMVVSKGEVLYPPR